MGIVGHEYTHAISNRMVGGPDEGITSEQGGAMGESWGDLVAGEYSSATATPTAATCGPSAPTPPATRRPRIRDYAINQNPLNYSDYGFDTTGPEVHADGEIWNGTQWEVRQALVEEVERAVPLRRQGAASSRCAQAQPATRRRCRPSQCPGNRRWIS